MFYLPDEPHSLRCNCCTGGDRSLALLPIYSMLHELDPVLAIRAEKEDDEQSDGETPTPDDPFYRDELALAALIGGLFATGIDKVQPAIDRALSGAYNAQAIDDALTTANATMSAVVDSAGGRKIGSLIDNLLITGAQHSTGGGSSTGAGITQHVGPSVARGTILEGAPSVEQVMNGITDSTKYYTNRYFNEIVVPAIKRDIQMVLDDTSHTHVPDLSVVRDALDKRLKSVPYWRLVANAAASRGFHYGLTKAGSMTGATSYTWEAIVDEKTSQICLDLNGRVFHIADAVNLMERAAAATPDDAKKLMPWPTSAQAKAIPNMSNDQLRDMGLLVPPAHGNCRSTIRLNYR